MKNITAIFSAFGLDASQYLIEQSSTGLINQTFIVSDKVSSKKFILQQLNTSIFKNPFSISKNIKFAAATISSSDENYPVINIHTTTNGNDYFIDNNSHYWRLMDFIKNTTTIEAIVTIEQAFQTAYSFGKFTSLLQQANTKDFIPSIPDFHNLDLRFEQFKTAYSNADHERKSKAKECIDYLMSEKDILNTFHQIINENLIPLRIIHADTKISNILFDKFSLVPKAVIDWDTIMPGYFISDLGDMIRTIVCEAGENESNLNKIIFRNEYYTAIISGYKTAIQLTENELNLLSYAGKFMTYMQALRFLTDYLNNDVYYTITYPEHNLDRAKNQCRLLQVLEENT
ncbi:MAG: aminoglycoside phosphotransferase family protein [Bacteroidota bacterium]